MAKDNSKRLAPDETDLEVRANDVREDVLADVPDKVQQGDNLEVGAADTFVDTEKTSPAERNANSRAVLTNHTLAGMPADVHQVLVGVAQHSLRDAQVYEEVKALTDKYKTEEGLSDEVRNALVAIKRNLEPLARSHEKARMLLEKHV